MDKFQTIAEEATTKINKLLTSKLDDKQQSDE